MHRSERNEIAEKRKRLAELRLRKEILDLQTKIDHAKSFRSAQSRKSSDPVSCNSDGKDVSAIKKKDSVVDRVIEFDVSESIAHQSPKQVLTAARKKIRSPVIGLTSANQSLSKLPRPNDVPLNKDLPLVEDNKVSYQHRFATFEQDLQWQAKLVGKLQTDIARVDKKVEQTVVSYMEKGLKQAEKNDAQREYKHMFETLERDLQSQSKLVCKLQTEFAKMDQKVEQKVVSYLEKNDAQDKDSNKQRFATLELDVQSQTKLVGKLHTELAKVDQNIEQTVVSYMEKGLKQVKDEQETFQKRILLNVVPSAMDAFAHTARHNLQAQEKSLTDAISLQLENRLRTDRDAHVFDQGAVETTVKKALVEERKLFTEQLQCFHLESKQSMDVLRSELSDLQNESKQLKPKIAEGEQNSFARFDDMIQKHIQKALKDRDDEHKTEIEAVQKHLQAVETENEQLMQQMMKHEQVLSEKLSHQLHMELQRAIDSMESAFETRLQHHCDTRIKETCALQESARQKEQDELSDKLSDVVRQALSASLQTERRLRVAESTENDTKVSAKIQALEEIILSCRNDLVNVERRLSQAGSEIVSSETARSKCSNASFEVVASRECSADSSRWNATVTTTDSCDSKMQAVRHANEQVARTEMELQSTTTRTITASPETSAPNGVVPESQRNKDDTSAITCNEAPQKIVELVMAKPTKPLRSITGKSTSASSRNKLDRADESSEDDSSFGCLEHETVVPISQPDGSSNKFEEEYQYVSDVESSTASYSGQDRIVELPSLDIGAATVSTANQENLTRTEEETLALDVTVPDSIRTIDATEESMLLGDTDTDHASVGSVNETMKSIATIDIASNYVPVAQAAEPESAAKVPEDSEVEKPESEVDESEYSDGEVESVDGEEEEESGDGEFEEEESEIESSDAAESTTSVSDDGALLGVDKLQLGDSAEVELRRRALALLGIGGTDPPSTDDPSLNRDANSSSNDEEDRDEEEDCSSGHVDDNGLPRSVLRPSSFEKEGFDWRMKPKSTSSPVSFSDDIKFHEIPSWKPEEKIHLFYDKVDINRFRLEDASKKQAKANKEKSKLLTAIDSLPSFWG